MQQSAAFCSVIAFSIALLIERLSAFEAREEAQRWKNEALRGATCSWAPAATRPKCT